MSPDEAWAAGREGTLEHYVDSVWQRVLSPTTTNLHSISAPSPDAVWAVGVKGVMVYWDGKQWALGPQFTTKTFY